MSRFDSNILIIGAGPAGLQAARTLENLDIDYVLMSREKEPCKDKACGGFIPQRALDDFKIGPIPKAHRIQGVRMKFPGMDIQRVDFNESIGVDVTRGSLGLQMMSFTDEEHIWLNTFVNRVSIGPEDCRIGYSRGEEKGVFRSKTIIDASGVNSVSVRHSLVRDRISNDSLGYAVQYQLKKQNTSESFDDVIDFYYGSEYSHGGYAWLFPREREAVLGSGGLINRVRASDRPSRSFLDYMMQEVYPVCDELAETEVMEFQSALVPLAGVVRPSYANRILLAGDAAGHCSPISGEGIYYSMIAGDLAAEITSQAISKDDFSKEFLSRYEKKWRSAFGSDLKWGLYLQKRLTKSGSGGLGSSFLKSEKSKRIIAEMLVGRRSVRSAILRVLPHYIRSKIH